MNFKNIVWFIKAIYYYYYYYYYYLPLAIFFFSYHNILSFYVTLLSVMDLSGTMRIFLHLDILGVSQRHP